MQGPTAFWLPGRPSPSSTLKGKQGDQSGLPFFFAEPYEGRELPAVLVRLLNDKVWCEQAGEYVLMDDPARVHLTAKAEI